MKTIKVLKVKNINKFIEHQKKFSKLRNDRVKKAEQKYNKLKKLIHKTIKINTKRIRKLNGSYALQNLGICLAKRFQKPYIYVATIDDNGIIDIEISYRYATIIK